MRQTTEDLKEELTEAYMNLQVAMLALDCLQICEEDKGFSEAVSPELAREYRYVMHSFMEQHATSLSGAAERLISRYQKGLPEGSPAS